MENASKALLMAGGILIAIIIISVLVKTFKNISVFQKAQLTEEEQAQLVAFNEQYTKYLNQYVYGSEVITVINKTLSNKIHRIDTVIKFNEGYEYTTYEYKNGKKIPKTKIVSKGSSLKITNQNDKDDDIVYDMINTPEKGDDSLMSRAFKCTEINFDSYGRVNSIKFEEKQWGNVE